ncbi:hypothetical protein AB0M46_01300 [Dactylosporangium sp. NPDC051485]|uniref:hypothetical protein n=1 Tax=Dactylosporangium sp. NPDC051485 TaxID=3154846 RepID=UPI00343D24AF
MSRYEAGPAQGSSRTFTVVLLSLLILTVVGALFGYVIGRRDIDEDKSASGNGPSAVPPGVTSAAATRKAPSLPGIRCPEFIGEAAKTLDGNTALPLMLVQYIRTAKGREVWICQESDGSGLWYQGHDRKQDFYDGGELPQEGVNGLLRPGAQARGNRTWTVTNEGTTYTVTPSALKVTGGQNFTDTAIQANPPA